MNKLQLNYYYGIYKFSKIYLYSIKNPKAPTFSQNCLYNKKVYIELIEYCITTCLFLINSDVENKSTLIMSLLMILIKMNNRFNTFIHVSGFWIINIFSLKKLYKYNKKHLIILYYVCFCNFIILTLSRKSRLINKLYFYKLYLSNQYILSYILNYSNML